MARIPQRLPSPLSQRLSGTSSTLLARNGREIDIAIAGLPFLLATSNDVPQTVETIPLRKDQVDTEQEPGESAISTAWWRRSQDSWHEGAGNLYQEARASLEMSIYRVSLPNYGFYDSRGVDVWTKGQFSLLRAMVLDATPGTGHSRIKTYTDSGTEKVSSVKAGQLYTGANPSALASLHAPVGKTIVDGFVSGTTFYDVATDGTLYQGLTSSPGTATNWPTASGATRIKFGHGRLWLIAGTKLFQPNLSLAGGTAQTAIYTNTNPGFSYTCLAEAPAGMLFGGHDGRVSTIQIVTLNTDGSIPTLSGAINIATLPDGELVQELSVMAGQFVGIGTSKGFRVGVIEGTTLTYGPLLVTPPSLVGCTALTQTGTFFLVGFNVTGGRAELWKVDTSTQLAEGTYPYARDVECATTGYVTHAAIWGGNVIATDDTGNVYEQHATNLVASGYLTTGRIRFRTQEKKLFKYVELDTDSLYGTVVIDAIGDSGTTTAVSTWSSPAHDPGSPPLQLTSALGPQRQMAFNFTLYRDGSNAAKGPVIRSYLVRALPSVKPQRMITLPLLCFDREQGHSGQRYGYEGYAADRLQALQTIEDLGDSCVYQNFGLLDQTGEVVVIDSMKFVQTAPGHPRENASGRGGILIVQLRTVSA